MSSAAPRTKAGAPIRRNPGQWATLPDCKRVLFVIHTLVYGQRLQDLLPLLRADLRINVVFTVAPHAFNAGVPEFLHRLGGIVLPWREAVRTDFDLVLAAGSQGVEQLRGPLLRLPHGAGHIKLSRLADTSDRSVGGLGRRYLTWQGRVVPSAIALAHRSDLDTLARSCPEALPVASVIGDACYDRIAASLPLREDYRRALGLRPAERLVLVCSTWGLGSSFNRLDALLPRLLAELPTDTYRTALLVHPNVFAGHGRWQIDAWLHAHARRGVGLIPPETDWRQLLIAADHLIGDHGSVTLYGALTRTPMLLARFPFQDVNPDSPAAQLARTAPALSLGHSLADQLAYTQERHRPAEFEAIAAGISSEPGGFNRNARALIYRLLGLGEPAYEPVTEPLPLPSPLTDR
ncbi:hypothetical protein F4556_006869 [Kitasatospora gansuensis]|uniref:Uncharacterized protein n=1 Tax=Kitasatospora gansuensis TaxID=258050 RepID=A0A7W7SIX6_9ACTN|nr:hypothetical protein [Kitasatospora gansuensis]MBB4951334.1 hypothetical protein [Kitasatospora gansuensis]